MMKDSLDDVKLYAESSYRKLVAIHFDLKQAKQQTTDIRIDDIQIMFNELKHKLLNLNIRTKFPPIQYNDTFDDIKMVEAMMLHLENIVSVLNTLHMKHNDDSNEHNREIVTAAHICAKDTLWKVRVVESKLDTIVNARPSRWGNHNTIETYIDTKELYLITEDLAIYLEKFEKTLKKLNINESLVFSLDIPAEYLKNYLKFLFVPCSIFTEKFEQIQTLRKRIEQIIEVLKSSK